MTDALWGFAQRFLAELAAVVAPTGRLFGAYLAGAALLAVAVWALHGELRRRVAWWRFLVPLALWRHPSAWLDVKLLLVRTALGSLLFVPALWTSQQFAVKVALACSARWGIGALCAAPRAWAVASFTVAAFVLRDFARYWLHRAAHRLGPLWELHQVHHSAEVLTPLTLHRTHPLEALLMRGASAAAVGLAAGVCAWLFHGGVSAWEIVGVDALGFVWTITGANLRHSHVWLRYGRGLEHVLISPAQHQLHHSVEARHHDRNFGEALAVWDWVFGTLEIAGPRERLVFGVAAGERNHGAGVLSILVDPVVAALRRLRSARPAPPRLEEGGARG